MMMKRIIAILVVFAAVPICTGAIQSVSLNNADTSYETASDELSVIANPANINVDYESGTQNTYSNGSFSMVTFLQSDSSEEGIASGQFGNGTFTFKDSSNNVLLSGNSVSMQLIESFDGGGILTGSGSFQVTGGNLESDFGQMTGEIVQVSFRVTPASISNFSEDFEGSTNISAMPVPEPATIALLGIGGLAAVRRKKSVL